MWEAIKQVSSGFSLVAFLLAIVATIVLAKISKLRNLIREAPEGERAKLIQQVLERFHVDTSNLTREQKVELVGKLLNDRQDRYKYTANVAVVSLAMLVGLAAYAISKSTQLNGNGGNENRNASDNSNGSQNANHNAANTNSDPVPANSNAGNSNGRIDNGNRNSNGHEPESEPVNACGGASYVRPLGAPIRQDSRCIWSIGDLSFDACIITAIHVRGTGKRPPPMSVCVAKNGQRSSPRSAISSSAGWSALMHSLNTSSHGAATGLYELHIDLPQDADCASVGEISVEFKLGS